MKPTARLINVMPWEALRVVFNVYRGRGGHGVRAQARAKRVLEGLVRAGLPGQAGGAQAGQPGLAHSPLFTHTGSGDATRPGHVADDYNPQVPPQADPAPRPHGEDVTLDSDR